MNICVNRPSYNIDKFIQEQIDHLIKNPKTHELIERISFQEEISKEKALRLVLEKLANQITGANNKPKMALVR
jgi:hypothetical protein